MANYIITKTSDKYSIYYRQGSKLTLIAEKALISEALESVIDDDRSSEKVVGFSNFKPDKEIVGLTVLVGRLAKSIDSLERSRYEDQFAHYKPL